MDLPQLRAFCAVVEEGGISGAANVLHLTQPAISTRISRLEAELGCELFLRQGHHRLILSKYGELLLPDACELVGLAERAYKRMKRAQSTSLWLNIATTRRIASYVLPPLLDKFKLAHPEIDIDVQTTLAEGVIEMLNNGSVDIGITNSLVRTGMKLESVPLVADSLILVASPRHPLYEATAGSLVEPKDLADHVLINYSRETSLYKPVIDYLRLASITPEHTMSIDSIEVMKAMVSHNMGVAFLPKTTVHQELAEGALIELPFAWCSTSKSDTLLFYQAKRYINPAVSCFLDVAEDWLKNAI